ncbi:hypothetical protein BST61_g7678 [Cercospora zeina]
MASNNTHQYPDHFHQLVSWAANNANQQQQQQQQQNGNAMAYPPTLQVNVDTERFIQTRNALTSAYIGLSSSIDTAIKAYIAHTDVVLQGAGTFDISQLLLPFQGVAGAAQVAEQAIQNGLVQLAAVPVDANGNPVDSTKRREKRPYKQRDPNAPKRPLTAYFRYLKEVRPFIAKEVAANPPSDGTKAGDISKIATERWRAMTEAQRKPYHAAYQSELSAYEEATKAYKAAGGKVEDAEEGDAEVESPSALPGDVAAAAEDDSDDDSSSEDSSSSEESDEDDEVPAKLPTPPPPPPPKKTPKAAPKKVKAAADATPATNMAIDPQLTSSAPIAQMTPSSSAVQPQASSKKRKAGAAVETPGTADGGEKKQRSKSNKKDDVLAEQAASAAQLQVLESSQPDGGSGTEKKKRKKRKSEAAAA